MNRELGSQGGWVRDGEQGRPGVVIDGELDAAVLEAGIDRLEQPLGFERGGEGQVDQVEQGSLGGHIHAVWDRADGPGSVSRQVATHDMVELRGFELLTFPP